MTRKEGVASAEELEAFVAQAGEQLLVIDVRTPDPDGEDVQSIARTALPSDTYRPKAINLIWDRTTHQMPLPPVPKDTPIVTHCGAGSRGQLAKEFLELHGFTNVINGGGPKETDCWAIYGEK